MNYRKILLGIFALFCLIISLIVIMPSGMRRCENNACGDYYYGAHEHDGVWHIAVSEMLINSGNWQMPTFAGENLTGYNYGIDLLVAGLSRATTISTKDWYFRGLPLLWGLGIIYYLFQFAKRYRPTPSFPWFLLIFSFFGSSFSYALNLFHNGTIWGSSGLLSMQALQVMTNPQLGLSLLLLLVYLNRLMGSHKTSYKESLVLGLLVAASFALKFYTGVILAFIVFVNFILELKSNSKNWFQEISRHLVMAIPVLLVAVWLYQPSGKPFPLVWKPFATVAPLIEDSQLFYISIWAQRLYTTSGVALFGLNLLITLIFIVMNYGVRFVALFAPLIKKRAESSRTLTLLITGSVVGLLISVLFVQTGIWWNTVQFLHVSLFLSGIIAAEVFDQLYVATKWRFAKASLLILLVAALLPNNLDVIRTFTSSKGTSYVSEQEIEALNHLRDLPEGIVFTSLFKPGEQTSNTTPLLSHRFDTAYVTAYSGKVTYFADLTQLQLLSIPYTEREKMVASYDCQILKEVDYLYEEHRNRYLHLFSGCSAELRERFRNEFVSIHEIVQ